VESGLALAEEAFEALEGRWRAVDPAVAVIEALVALEDWPALAKFLPRAKEITGASPELRFACVRAEGQVAAAEGRRDEAVAKLREAREGFEGLEDVFEAARTREVLAGVVEDAAERRLLLEQARGTYGELGAKPHLGRLTAAVEEADRPAAEQVE
jgi:hypothetical protein